MHKTYIRQAKGDTAVFFIHGFLGSSEHFKSFISCVPEDIAVYNILLEGHGGTVGDFAKASMKKWKNQINSTALEILSKYKNIIIMGHSMGALFAMELAEKYPDNVKTLFLLGVPLKIAVKATATVNSLKSIFNLISDDDETGRAYQNAHSVKLNMKLWEYIGWIPRYLELFCEARRGRELPVGITASCYVFQSKKDELVSLKSLKYFPQKENIKIEILENSSHFIYSKYDYARMENQFKKTVGRE